MSGVNERVQDTACAQSKLSTRDWNWELIIVSAVLIVFISLFMVHSSKEHSVCNRCTCESDLILKLTEKLTVVEKTIEELKVKEQVTRSGMYHRIDKFL